MAAPISTTTLMSLATALGKWLQSLTRARHETRNAAREALRDVIIATRETAVYCRFLKEDHHRRDPDTEAHLAMLWSTLGFRLEDIGQRGLAKRCQIKGRYWADQGQFGEEFLQAADISLATVERMATTLHARL